MTTTACLCDRRRHFGVNGNFLQEPQAAACKAAIVAASPVLISAGTFVEALIVAGHRNLGVEMTALIDGLDFEVEPVTSASARSVSRAYETWGKGATQRD